MKAVGIFGGTFDPVHNGHLITAQSILEKRNLEKIIFVPCNISPHKINRVTAEAHHRLQMIKIAISNFPKFEYSDYEIKTGDISYTLDTLKEFSKIYSKLELIIGYDNLIKFDAWREPDKILELAKLVVMKRSHESNLNIFHKYFGKAIYVDTPIIEISSSKIRERIANGQIIDALVPEKVKEYIYAFELYKR
jgi:nicotinate-nucleotide adenylyltransferase